MQKSRLILMFFRQLNNVPGLSANGIIILPAVGTQAVGTVLDAVLCVSKITTAALTQGVKGAVAEQTAKGLRICIGMARKIFTVSILEEIIGHCADLLVYAIIVTQYSRGNPAGDLIGTPWAFQSSDG